VRICHHCRQHDASASCHLQNDGRAAVSSCGASGFRHGVLCMPCDAVPDFTDGVLTGRWASTQGDLPSVVDQL
jgi:transcription elongation factor Elf1